MVANSMGYQPGYVAVTDRFLQQALLLSPLADLVSIPWVSLVVLPVALLSLCLIPLSQTLAVGGLHVAALSLQGLLTFLVWMVSGPINLIHLPTPSPLVFSLALLGAAIVLLPRRFPARYLGICLLLPLFFPVTYRPAYGDARLSLLDVGQRLSAIIQTHKHTLVFDTGPRYGPGLDAGHAVILPYLRRQGIAHIDTLLVSHSDMDHIGGAHSLLQDMPVLQVMSNVSNLRRNNRDKHCFAGQHWQWEGVGFAILYPRPNDYTQARTHNNRSCVLQITTTRHRLLLTADIERAVEAKLLSRYGEKLHSEVLVIPHHGSKTSSSPSFLAAVNPELALIPSGWHNRFHLPAKAVVARLRAKSLQLFDTATAGAIQVELNALWVKTYRQHRQRNWQAW